jgi:hypothetical protein
MWFFSPWYDPHMMNCHAVCRWYQGQWELRRTSTAAWLLVHRAVKSRGRGSGGHSEEGSHTITVGSGF